MDEGNPTLIRETQVLGNAFGKSVSQAVYEYSDGHTEDHLLFSIGPTVTIVALVEDDADGGIKVIAVEEFKEGINDRHIALPGARINSNTHEKAINAAMRRLRQETGYEPRCPSSNEPPAVWLGAGPFMARSCKDEVYVVLLRNCTKVTEPALRAGEHVAVIRYGLDHLLTLISENKISDVHAGNAVFRALLYLEWIKLHVPSR